jgi:L-cystine uptake protein TcyP (sodium:dicarboxylate symporter family)
MPLSTWRSTKGCRTARRCTVKLHLCATNNQLTIPAITRSCHVGNAGKLSETQSAPAASVVLYFSTLIGISVKKKKKKQKEEKREKKKKEEEKGGEGGETEALHIGACNPMLSN